MSMSTTSATLGTGAGPPTGLPSQLELFLITQPIIKLSGGIFARFGHFFHQFLRLNNLFEDFALVGFAEHTANVHLE